MTSSITPKKLRNAVGAICIEKNIGFESIDMDSELSTKNNMQKLFIEVCIKGRDGEIVRIDSTFHLGKCFYVKGDDN